MLDKLKKEMVRWGPRHPITRTALKFAAIRSRSRVEFREREIQLHQRGITYVLAEKDFTYIPMMLAHAEQYFEPVVPDSPNRFNYAVPAWHKYARTGLTFFLPSFPEEEDGAIYTRQYMPVEGDVVWDVGAHAGVSTYYFSKLVGDSGKVFAWEPDEINYQCLMKNIEHHSLKNVIPVKKALAGLTGKASFQSEGTMGSTFSGLAPYCSSSQTIEVETISLEDACAELATPRFIKMDIEGSEKQVVEKALGFLAKQDIAWSIEANHLVDGRLTYLDMEELFPKAGYRVQSEQINGYYFCWASRSH
jgi:FkbM family methyltransferase